LSLSDFGAPSYLFWKGRVALLRYQTTPKAIEMPITRPMKMPSSVPPALDFLRAGCGRAAPGV
jgi:hypothetical protein